MYYTHTKIAIQKMLVFSHTKITVVHAQNYHTFFPYKMLCNTRTQKLPYKNASIFPIQKLPYIFPIQNLCNTRTQKLPYKNVSVFLHTQKILCNPRKNY